MDAKRILVGEFGRPHGVRGLLRLRSFTEAPEAIAAYGTLTDESGQRSFAFEVLPGGLARVRGVNDRDAAARLTGVKLYVLREALPACVDRAQVVEIGQSNRNQWLLVPGTAWHAGCHAGQDGTDAAGDDNDD